MIYFPSKKTLRLIFAVTLTAGISVTGAALLSGCTSTSSKATQQAQKQEAILKQCGFKTVSANTPAQIQKINTLPPGKISVVKRNGNRYYVYPDSARQLLFVGGDFQYLKYQNYLTDQAENAQFDAMSKMDPSISQYNNEAEVLIGNERLSGWNSPDWGSWDVNN
jgi:hypothetical protein